MTARAHSLFLFCASLMLSACGTSPPIRYYQLTPLNATTTQNSPAAQGSLGIGPIQWPEYLEHSRRIIRQNDTSLSLAENERWLEPLENNFARVLRENIARLSQNEDIQAYPWPTKANPAVQVRLEVLRFDNDAQGKATLEVRWQIQRSATPSTNTKRSLIEVSARNSSSDAAVNAQNQALDQLSREIYAALK